MSGPRKLEPARALAHPIWLASLGLLVLNDHVFKGSGLLPGWLTGKLSDLAGLIVAPVLLAAIVRARTPRAVAVVNVVVGAGFAALELSASLTALADSVVRLAGLRWQSTSDATDLLALAVLPLAYLLTMRAGAERGTAALNTLRILGAAGLLACAASVGNYSEQQPPCENYDCDFDGYEWPEDCNDYDPTLTPDNGCPAPDGEDACDNGVDDDGDLQVDCQDPDCNLACADTNDACLLATATSFAEVQVLEGSTLAGTSAIEGSCLGADSPEVIFAGATQPGILTLGVPAGHGVHVRGSCVDATSETACVIASEAGGESIELAVGGESIAVIVEALDPFSAGPFQVPVQFWPAGCGDGERVDPEECDDGNHTGDDGCSPSCTAETELLCAAMPVAAAGETMDSFAGATTSFVGCAGSYDLPERGYHYTATSTSVSVSVSSTADVSLYATFGCGDTSFGFACADAVLGGGQETVLIETQFGDELTLFVELGEGEPADAMFTLSITEP